MRAPDSHELSSCRIWEMGILANLGTLSATPRLLRCEVALEAACSTGMRMLVIKCNLRAGEYGDF